MAVICFAGCDKVGKTTLLREVLKRTNEHICIDRFAACQYVYGNYYDKIDTPSKKSLYKIESSLQKVGGLYIYVTADTEDIKKRFIDHNENSINVDDIDLIKKNYKRYLEYAWMPVFYINTSIDDIDTCVKKIIDCAKTIDYRLKLK